ncbi:MAG: SDR family oxidoreductase [Balneolales bacterium]|nr:SDR family oxidoreductase [Balneolales bacterium]
MDFKSKTVLITGASSGIGAVFCSALAERGAKLVITARREERLLEIARRLKDAHQTEVVVIAADLSSTDGVEDLHRAIEGGGHEIDILINNAGFGYQGEFEDTDLKTYRDMMQLNMNSLTELCYLFLPGMAARGYGRVVNVASMAGVIPMPYFSVYAATKAYVISLTEALWQEYKQKGVHITALCPGPVATEFFEVSGYNPSGADGRSIQTPQDVVEVALSAMHNNKRFAATSWPLRILNGIQKFVPRKIALAALAQNMKKS